MNKYGVRVMTGPSVIKDVDASKGTVISYPSTFDVVDSGQERVKRGAFNRTINAWGPEGKKRTKVLFNHEPWNIIGRPLVLREDDYGLYAESKIVPTTLGKDILMLVENEVITEQSIGFTPVRTMKNEDEGVLDILEVKLYEYSFLAWGMNSETPIIGMKDEERTAHLVKDMRRVEKILHSGEFSTEEIPEMLQRALAQWQEDLTTMTKTETDPVADFLATARALGDAEAVKRAIHELQSLLPQDPPSGTPDEQDTIESKSDSGEAHSEALQRLLKKVSETNEREGAELAAVSMLREFQKKLGL